MAHFLKVNFFYRTPFLLSHSFSEKVSNRPETLPENQFLIRAFRKTALEVKITRLSIRSTILRRSLAQITLNPWILARSKYELNHWVKSIFTHYFMEIFVGQRIVKTLALLYILQHLIGVHTKQVPIAHWLWLLKYGGLA